MSDKNEILSLLNNPEKLHYSSKSQTAKTVQEAAQYWLRQADLVMKRELAEEILDGTISTGSNWWRAEIHKRALQLIEADDQLRPAYKTKLWTIIENEALYHYAGYESSLEWMASSGKGGAGHDFRWLAHDFKPWCEQNQVFGKETQGTLLGTDANLFFDMPVNPDPAKDSDQQQSRHNALRAAIPTLRRVIDPDHKEYVEDLEPEERTEIVRGILETAADPKITQSNKKKLYNVRESKIELTIWKNGDGRWHLAGSLTDRNLESLERDLAYSAIIEIIDPEEAKRRGLLDSDE